MLRILFFVGLGLAIAGGVVQFAGSASYGGSVLAVGFVIMSLSGALISVGKVTKSFTSVASEKEIADARSAGRLAVARIDKLDQTGQYLNEQPLCVIELTVQPRFGQAFRTVTRRMVRLTEIPQFQPGSRHVVAVISEGDSTVAFVDDDPNAGYWADYPIPSVSQAGDLPAAGPGSGAKRMPFLGQFLGRDANLCRFGWRSILSRWWCLPG